MKERKRKDRESKRKTEREEDRKTFSENRTKIQKASGNEIDIVKHIDIPMDSLTTHMFK